MPAPAPLISVILVCRNPGAQLPAALGSVWAQRDADCELIVIDGASTDGSREWLEAQRARIATLVSEPDRGVYEAMNKGLAAATGTWALFLGADDRLASNHALALAAAHLRETEAGVLVGEASYDDGRVYSPTATPAVVRRNFVHHQAAFYRRTLIATRAYDAGLRYQADYDLNLRLWRSGTRFLPIPLRVSHCGSGGLSDAGHWANYREEIAVRHRYFSAWQCWPWDAASSARWLRKRTMRPRPQ